MTIEEQRAAMGARASLPPLESRKAGRPINGIAVLLLLLLVLIVAFSYGPTSLDVNDLGKISNIAYEGAKKTGECVDPGAELWSSLSIDQRAIYALSCINATLDKETP